MVMPQNVLEAMTLQAAPAAETPDDTSEPSRAAYRRGASAWPALRVTYEQFREQSARANRGSVAPPSHPEDFYLCVACANADALAHDALEARYFPPLRAIVGAMLADAAAVDDVLQNLRMRLLAGSAAKIGSYRGHGPLGSWLRKVALHAARDYCRSTANERRRRRALCLAQQSQPCDEPEATALAIADARSERECEQAWSAAKGRMQRADIELLEHRFASGMSIDALSPIYAVHRATIARRVQRALQRVRRIARSALAAEHRDLAPYELDAMMRDWCARREASSLEL